MLDFISRGDQGHGPIHLLLISAAELGFAWDEDEKDWVRVSLPPLRMMTGPVQHFRSAILDAWRFQVFAGLSERKGFWGCEYADFQGSLQLLTSSHLRERNKMLSRAILCGDVWNGFLLGKAKKEDVPCRFCGKKDGDGHLFWECTFHPLQHVRDLPEFAYLLSLDRSKWPRCLLWRGWLPGLNGVSVLILLTLIIAWLLLSIGILMMLPWRCLVLVLVFICLLLSFLLMVWGTAEEYGDARLERCRAFMPVPGILQTVQRAEFWGAILAMQAYWPCHFGIDNLHVARSIGRLLDHGCLVKPLPLVKDGASVALVRYMIRTRGRETVRATEVKGHAEDADVQQGRVGWWINRGMLKLMLLLMSVIDISLRSLLMLGVGCFRLVVIGIR